MALQGGTLRGTGSITGGDVQNTGGTLAPGTSPGALSLTDDYSQGPGGTLAVEDRVARPAPAMTSWSSAARSRWRARSP